LQPPGGGNAVAAWIVQALKDDYEVHVLRWQPVDLGPINRHYGTSLQREDLTELSVSPVLQALVDRIAIPLSLLKTALMLRLCKKWNDRYDVIMTANNEADFGRRGIQYVHYPWVAQPRPPEDLRWYHFSQAALRVYYAFCEGLFGYSNDGMKGNLTLVNSAWSADKVREVHGIEATVLHPPAAGAFPDVPWEERGNGFVCIGRISPEKRLEKIIDILTAVRGQREDVHLHVVGSPDDADYCERIRQLVRENADWTFLHEDVSREELVRIVTTHRYGIHGMVDEHFGMAVAEMVRGGCIVFVPNSGGAVEIVGDEPHLKYDDLSDAVEKIGEVLDDPGLRERVRTNLGRRRELCSAEHFVDQIREVVRRL
jgi:glycosyltransferase involved in cell wall biosynthesis